MKFFNAFVLFVTLFVAQSYTYKVDITLEQARELKINTCKTDKDCAKEYETSCYRPNENIDGHCISKLFCRSKEQCIFEVNNEDESLIVNYQNVTTGRSFFESLLTGPQLIIESCNEFEAAKGSCYTRECSKNEDCSSGRCVNSICVTNSNPLYLCSNNPYDFVNVNENDFPRDALTCKLAEQETCKKARECMNFLCHTIDGHRICADRIEDSTTTTTTTNWFVKLIKIVFEFLGLFIVALLIFIGVKNYKNKKSYGRGRSDTKVRYEMEEAFLKNKDYVELEEIDEYDFEQVRKYSNKL